MEEALDNEIEMDEALEASVCHPERAKRVEGSRAASAGESSEWERLSEKLHPGVSVRLPLSRIPSKSYAHVKRVLDIACAAVSLVALSPVLYLIGIGLSLAPLIVMEIAKALELIKH